MADIEDFDIDNDCLDDVEPVGDEAQLYEHFRVVVDKGQEMIRVDKYLFDRITNASRGNYFGVGALGDSFYEYLLKAWLQGGKTETVETGGPGEA